MKNIDQLELGLNNARLVANSLHHRQRRVSRAKWWFAQMRRAVDKAVEWQPAPPARPEQTWLAGTTDARPLAQKVICE